MDTSNYYSVSLCFYHHRFYLQFSNWPVNVYIVMCLKFLDEKGTHVLKLTPPTHSIDYLSEVIRHAIESGSRIKEELILEQGDFMLNVVSCISLLCYQVLINGG